MARLYCCSAGKEAYSVSRKKTGWMSCMEHFGDVGQNDLRMWIQEVLKSR